MPEVPEFTVVKAAWLNQPAETLPVDIGSLHRPRAWELFSTTRSEILWSIGAALFFASVMAWRFAPERNRPLLYGCAGVVVWAALTAFRYRHSIRRNPPPPDTLASTGLEHYRTELLRRRDHLRSAWIWHGPLLLACILSASALTVRIVPRRIWDALPFVLLLAAWAAIGIKRRLKQAAALQREIDELTRNNEP